MGPDLKQIVCQHRRAVETTQNIGFNPSVPSTECYIPNRRTTFACQWKPAVWIEVKERPEVTRDGNSSSGETEYVNLSLAITRQFRFIVWQPVRLRLTGPTTWGWNGRPEPYGWNCSCIKYINTACGSFRFSPYFNPHWRDNWNICYISLHALVVSQSACRIAHISHICWCKVLRNDSWVSSISSCPR